MPWRIVEVLSNGQIDDAFIVGHIAGDGSDIDLLNLAIVKLSAQFAVCFGVAGHHHDARSVTIKPVHNPRPRNGRRNASGQAVCLVRPNSRYGEQSCGFVHYDNAFIHVNDRHAGDRGGDIMLCSITHLKEVP